MFNKGQLAGLMKQAQAMQDNLKKAQDELAFVEVEGASGGGMVKVLMTCKHVVKRVTIDPSLLADDKDMLEDLIAAAFTTLTLKLAALQASAAQQTLGLLLLAITSLVVVGLALATLRGLRDGTLLAPEPVAQITPV